MQLSVANGTTVNGVFSTSELTLAAGSTLTTSLTSVGNYTQITSSGPININGAILSVSATSGLYLGDSYITLIKNNGGSAVNGTFVNSSGTGLTEGSILTLNGQQFKLTYKGGASGGDVVLLPVAVYVDSDWLGFSTNQAIVDADPFAPGNQSAAYGVTAFSTVDAAITAASTGELIIVSGSFAGTGGPIRKTSSFPRR